MALGWKKQYLRYKGFFLNILAVYKNRQDVKIFLELILSLTTVSFFAIFALRPTLVTIAQVVKDNRTKEETITAMDEKIQNLRLAQEVYNKETSRIPLIRSSIPLFPQPEMFVRQIEGLASKNAVSIIGFNINSVTLVGQKESKQQTIPSVLPENARGLEFSISASGNYSSLKNFLTELENLRRPVKIISTTLNASVSEQNRTLVLSVSGITPFLEDTNIGLSSNR